MTDLDKIIRHTPPGATLGEGPLWSKRDRCIYWVDILENTIHAWYLDGTTRSWHVPEHIGWLIEREKGGFICGLMSGFAELTLDPLTIRHIHNPYPHEPLNRLNDAKADANGRIWAGSMHKPITQVSGALYRLDPDMSVREMDGPYKVANGPAFTADHAQVYHTDTGIGEVYLFNVTDNGELADKRLFVKFSGDMGAPDGMTVDAEGGLWIASWGGACVIRFNTDGTEDFRIAMPAKQITSIIFGGDRLDRAFCTSAAENRPDDREAGTLFEIPSDLLRGHTGLEPMKFKG